MPFQHLSCEQLKTSMDAEASDNSGSDAPPLLAKPFTLIDIRDRQSFEQGHIAGAIHIDNGNVDDFLMRTDKSLPLVVCCYHGNSSQGAADYFQQQGFHQSFSLDGGYEYWKTLA